jgi:tetrahydromethanopterin S-methyltransferase subunit A
MRKGGDDSAWVPVASQQSAVRLRLRQANHRLHRKGAVAKAAAGLASGDWIISLVIRLCTFGFSGFYKGIIISRISVPTARSSCDWMAIQS